MSYGEMVGEGEGAPPEAGADAPTSWQSRNSYDYDVVKSTNKALEQDRDAVHQLQDELRSQFEIG